MLISPEDRNAIAAVAEIGRRISERASVVMTLPPEQQRELMKALATALRLTKKSK